MLVSLAVYIGREVTKRAESSSFAKGRLEPKSAQTVTLVTQEYLIVIFRVKILYNPAGLWNGLLRPSKSIASKLRSDRNPGFR
ncbi:hypothetical protein EMIT0373P_30490 [Pseudomonas chlororaphis]